MRAVPAHAAAPSAFGSEVYAVAGRRVVVYTVQLDRWTPLPDDPPAPRSPNDACREPRRHRGHRLRPGSSAVVQDRWDGLSWHRDHTVSAAPPEKGPLPAGVAASGATRVRADGRWLVVARGRAWIRIS